MDPRVVEEKIPLLLSKKERVNASRGDCLFDGNTVNGVTNDSSSCLDWGSLLVVYLVTLLSESSRGLFLASQWPYLERLGGTKSLLGVFVALFSVGRMLSTVPLGFLSDRFSIKTVYLWCTVCQIFGHFLYCVAPRVSILLLSRVLVGFGSATMSISRAHVTKATTLLDRTKHFGYLSAVQFVGFAVLPLANGALAELPMFSWAFIVFDPLTLPGWTLFAANSLALLIIILYYRDPESTVSSSSDDNYTKSASFYPSQHRPDFSVLGACLFLNVCFRGVIAEFETISSPLMIDMYHVSVADTGFIIGMLGCLGLAWYLSLAWLSKFLGDAQLTLMGLLLLLIGTLWLAIPTGRPSFIMFLFNMGLVWSVAYPIGQTAVLSLFSKVLKNVSVGGFLGVFSALGSFARIIFACLAGGLWSIGGFRSVFTCAVIFVVASIFVFAFAFTSFHEQLKVQGRSNI
ncbi:Major facilitator superfamily domain-containing protein 8 [Galdieria sulphuraria]|uniref:MFS transporter, tetracycline:hydrogen antiporter n=1 Tax=Galdieria sulphuraria TaxID=130081 RepID=M2VXR7_GALSU|nr:MFS transporter, tetracycline:hydrogen antiporter [Galdieria sulphuraria]EME28081.1 MFS transporter, tetracycline:hydrogen antiporter [Galdieria sulphuraria]GJD12117.1 Major facilitator superfamily domain-containing protein 8 [Galdieria sulphuraria]|eukprot:XP_005704601.1 MFS transporter, tetracycline:hydrogen antiporter [Galdieria sulphuraria]